MATARTAELSSLSFCTPATSSGPARNPPESLSFGAAGLPVELFREGLLCGACVRMWCVDSICEDAGIRNATFMASGWAASGGNVLIRAAQQGPLGDGGTVTAWEQAAYAALHCTALLQTGVAAQTLELLLAAMDRQ